MGRLITVSEPLPAEMLSKLKKDAHELGFDVLYETDKKKAEEHLAETEIFFGILNPKSPIPQNLKWLCLPLAGVNDYSSRTEFLNGSCMLSCSSGAYGVTIAEHLVMLTLILLRRMPEYIEDRKERIWRNDRELNSIYGSRVTVLGTGDIGRNYAQRIKPFMPESVTGVSRSGKSECDAFTSIHKVNELDSILPETDILVMSLPETPDTIHILNGERIALLPKNAIIINVGRGSSIDQLALANALKEHVICGAALDVLEKEPLPESDPLNEAPNLIITPHMAGQRTLRRTVEIMFDKFLTDLHRYAANQLPENLVNLNRGY